MFATTDSRYAALGLTTLTLAAGGTAFYLLGRAAEPSSAVASMPARYASTAPTGWNSQSKADASLSSDHVSGGASTWGTGTDHLINGRGELSAQAEVADETVISVDTAVTEWQWSETPKVWVEPGPEPGAVVLADSTDRVTDAPSTVEPVWRPGGGPGVTRRLSSVPSGGVASGMSGTTTVAAPTTTSAAPTTTTPISTAVGSTTISSTVASRPKPTVPSTTASAPPPPVSPDDSEDADAPLDDPVDAAPSARPFTMWNALVFKNQPSHVSDNPDFPQLYVVYGGHIWMAHEDATYASEARIREIARSIEPGRIVCFDIEHWPLNPDKPAEFEANMAKYLDVLRWTRDENPTLKLGFYAKVLELRPDVSWLPYDDPRYVWHRMRNDKVKPILDEVDVLFPWMYTMIDAADKDKWRQWAIATRHEVERVGQGKPAYPFLWFRYHQNIPSRFYQMIEPDYWEMQIDTVRELFDGAVIWGGHRLSWDESAAWWQLTQPYLGKPVPIRWGD